MHMNINSLNTVRLLVSHTLKLHVLHVMTLSSSSSSSLLCVRMCDLYSVIHFSHSSHTLIPVLSLACRKEIRHATSITADLSASHWCEATFWIIFVSVLTSSSLAFHCLSREANWAALQADLQAFGGLAAVLQDGAVQQGGAGVPRATCQAAARFTAAQSVTFHSTGQTLSHGWAHGQQLTEQTGQDTVHTAVCTHTHTHIFSDCLRPSLSIFFGIQNPEMTVQITYCTRHLVLKFQLWVFQISQMLFRHKSVTR